MRPDDERDDRSHSRATAALLGVVAVVIIISFGQTVSDRFGDSHDGRNGAVWATASEAIRTEGLLGSKLGAELSDSTSYANHPPLISLETAAAESVLGVHRAVTRMPAWLGSICSLVLVWLIMKQVGLSTWDRAIGVVLAAGCPMFLAYGTMLDTPVTSLPFGLLSILVWQRSQASGIGSWSRLATAVLSVAAGWQAALAAGLTVLIDAARRSTRSAILGAGGILLGSTGVLLWQLWVAGSLGDLVDQLTFRSGINTGSHDVSLLGAMSRQAHWLSVLFTPSAIVAALLGLWLLIRAGGQRRDLALVLGATVLVYTVALPGGSYFHDYWSFWSVAPIAVGGAALSERLRAAVPAGWAAWWGTAVPAGIALVFAVIAAYPQNGVQRSREQGLDALELLDAAEARTVWAYGIVGSPGPWIGYETGKDVEFLDQPSQVLRLARERPDAQVLTFCHVIDPDDESCSETPYSTLSAEELATVLRGPK